LTTAAESQAGSPRHPGDEHLLPARYSERLVPVNDLMDTLVKQNGKVTRRSSISARSTRGSPFRRPSAVSSRAVRIDLMRDAGIDVQRYTAGAEPKDAD
jgi:hypothetical protein